MLLHVRLHKDHALLRIKAGGQEIQDNFQSAVGKARGVIVVRGKSVPIGDKEKAVVRILELDPVLQRANVVAEMQLAGGAHAAEDARTGIFWLIGHGFRKQTAASKSQL